MGFLPAEQMPHLNANHPARWPEASPLVPQSHSRGAYHGQTNYNSSGSHFSHGDAYHSRPSTHAPSQGSFRSHAYPHERGFPQYGRDAPYGYYGDPTPPNEYFENGRSSWGGQGGHHDERFYHHPPDSMAYSYMPRGAYDERRGFVPREGSVDFPQSSVAPPRDYGQRPGPFERLEQLPDGRRTPETIPRAVHAASHEQNGVFDGDCRRPGQNGELHEGRTRLDDREVVVSLSTEGGPPGQSVGQVQGRKDEGGKPTTVQETSAAQRLNPAPVESGEEPVGSRQQEGGAVAGEQGGLQRGVAGQDARAMRVGPAPEGSEHVEIARRGSREVSRQWQRLQRLID